MQVVELDAAVFAEGFILVGLDGAVIETHGARPIWELIQGHPWVVEQGIPVVVIWINAANEPQAYGPHDLVQTVTELDFDEIEWGHTLTLAWPDE